MNKFIFLFIFITTTFSGNSQEKQTAFIHKDKILDAMSEELLTKIEMEYQEEIGMMELLFKKKTEEVKKCVAEGKDDCSVEDTLEYYHRIEERKKQMEVDLFNKKMETRESNEIVLKKEMDQYIRKKGYRDWVDISSGIPAGYSVNHDYTEYMTLVLQ